MADQNKLHQAYYKPDCLWTSGKATKGLHKITSMSKKIYQIIVSKTSPLASPYTTSKRNTSSLLWYNSWIWFIYLMMFLKERSASISCLALKLHHDMESPNASWQKNQARLHLCWKQSITRKVACSNIPGSSELIKVLRLMAKRRIVWKT